MGPVDLIFNPIVDVPFTGIGALDFAPAERLAYNFSKEWAVALEHYADYGVFRHFEPADPPEQMLFAVAGYSRGPADVEFGIGPGLPPPPHHLPLHLLLTPNSYHTRRAQIFSP